MIKLTSESKRLMAKALIDANKLYQTLLQRELGILLDVLINDAKERGQYQNRTGNLRSSIGGVVLINGRVVHRNGYVKELATAKAGPKTGKNLLKSLIAQHKTGVALIVTAGMEYASYLEDGSYGGSPRNVLKQTERVMRKEIPKIQRRIDKAINKKSK